MNPRFLGDSFDLVKRSLIAALDSLGPWSVHPMFTREVSESEAAEYSALVGAPLVSCASFAESATREQWMARCRESANLFLDPDTGLRLDPIGSKRHPEYLFAHELLSLAEARPNGVTMVFDQSLARGAERLGAQAKLDSLARRGVHALAYHSHASFVVVATSRTQFNLALQSFRGVLKIPEARLLVGAV